MIETERMEKRKKATRSQRTLPDKCPNCGSVNFIHDHDKGETVCHDCALVLDEQMIDNEPEWRTFTQEEKASRSRVGMPASYSVPDKYLSTTISQKGRDASGKKLSLSTNQQMWRLRKWQIRSRVHPSIYRNLAQAMTELDRLSDKVYIPRLIKENAAVIYRKALDKSLVRGRSIAAIAAAALYAACRGSGTPKTLSEIAEASLVDKKDVARCYRLLLRELEVRMPIADPLAYVSRIAERTGISGKTQGMATRILREARDRRAAAGRDPMGLAAAALYIACLYNNEKKTQKDIGDAAGITEVTVRNRYRTLKRQLKLELLD